MVAVAALLVWDADGSTEEQDQFGVESIWSKDSKRIEAFCRGPVQVPLAPLAQPLAQPAPLRHLETHLAPLGVRSFGVL